MYLMYVLCVFLSYWFWFKSTPVYRTNMDGLSIIFETLEPYEILDFTSKLMTPPLELYPGSNAWQKKKKL